ncbi:SEL1-like repeat protein [Eggerthellaceae bacterium 3-80]|nr:sel1 repeat family protein [bacterium D16-34]
MILLKEHGEVNSASRIKISHDANIFEPIYEELTTYDNGDRLPNTWVTRAVYDDDDNYLGHTYTAVYVSENDPDGEDALYYGGGLYDEGMSLTDPAHADARHDCFKTAELLYRHAAAKGNALAFMCLGYVYYYDRCNGSYWVNLDELKTDEDYRRPFPTKERAFACFKAAADTGIAEAFYKLGDCYKNGIGCDPDERKAFQSYEQAAKHDDGKYAYLSGSIALRLAGCFEEGIGCEHDFTRALECYETAERYLDLAVSCGDYYYQGALRGARNGIARCKQEISLGEQ